MPTINFKQPKFVIPLILLPFLGLGFFVFSSFKGKSSKGKMTMEDSIAMIRKKGYNSDIPTVSSDVSNSETKDKFGAYTEAFKNAKDYSALNSIDNIKTNGTTEVSSYNTADIQRLEANKRMDSLRKSLEGNKQMIERRINGFQPDRGSAGNNRQSNDNTRFLEAMKNINRQPNNSDAQETKKAEGGSYDEQMRFFKAQLKMADSMQKANTPSVVSNEEDEETNVKNKKKSFSKDTSFKPLHVSSVRAYQDRQGFNTIRNFKSDENIKAIIDESKKVIAGAKVRIRLLQDISVGEDIILAGTFIYGVVTGFQTQRVNITITSINRGGVPLSVKLDVFDNDGYLGLYAPSSNFREFTKEVGTQSTSGMSNIQTSNGTTDITSSIISKVFQSSTNTVGKLISQNKVVLQQDYIIYLKENKSSNKN